MQDEKGNNDSNDEAGKGAAKDGADKKAPFEIERLLNVLEYSGGLVFTALAVICSESGQRVWSHLFGFGTVVCGVAIASHNLEKLGLKYVRQGAIGLLILAAIFIGQSALKKPEPKAQPHFTFSLNTSEATDDGLDLTNSFLSFTNFGKSIISPTCNVFFPKSLDKSDVGLVFTVINDSPTLAEDVEVAVLINSQLKCLPDIGWMPTKNKTLLELTDDFGNWETNKKQVWTCRLHTMLSSNGLILPNLLLPQAPLKTNSVFFLSWRERKIHPHQH
jgi:hypothetical protein